MFAPDFHRPSSHLPIVAAAVHDGHALRPEIARRIRLSDSERLREEDPFTGEWTAVADWQIVGKRSRFEVDLNRPLEKAVYLRPEDCWNLQVWKSPLPRRVVRESLRQHRRFYAALDRLMKELLDEHGHVVVYDIHSYNHQRQGPDGPPADPRANPEVNIGTGTMDRRFWGPVVDELMEEIRDYDFDGRHLDVRENVKFQGGYFPQWLHEHYPDQVCCIAIEFKKFFMDEWTGEPDEHMVHEIGNVLDSTVRGVTTELDHIPVLAHGT